MLIYIIYILFLYLLIKSENHRNSKICLFFSFLFLFLIVAFRDYTVGTDTSSYIDEYNDGTSFLRSTDVGFSILCATLRYLGLSSRQFMIVATLLILLPLYYYLKSKPDKRLLSVFLYFTIGNFVFNMTGIRQSVAIGVATIGLVLCEKNSKLLCQLLILSLFLIIAYFIHGSSIICILYIPIIILAKWDFVFYRKWKLLVILLPILSLFLTSIFSWLVNSFMISKYEHYETGSSDSNIIAYFVIPYVMFLYSAWLFYKRRHTDNMARTCFLSALVYAICASSSMYMPILARMGYFFSLPMLYFIGHYTYELPYKTRTVLIIAMLVVCTLFFYISQTDGILGIDNYKFSIK